MNIIPLSKENHGDWSYVGLSNYLHAKKNNLSMSVISSHSKMNRNRFPN